MSELGSRSPVKLDYFSGAEPLTEGFLNSTEVTGIVPDAEKEGYISLMGVPRLANIRPDYLSRPLDYSYVSHIANATVTTLGLVRVRLLTLKQARGHRLQPFMGEVSTCKVELGDATYDTSRTVVGSPDGLTWTAARAGKYLNTGLSSFFRTGLYMQYIREKNWRVHLGYEGSPTISFVTDPVGAREAFRLRDIPNGEGRRKALRHWVEEHWRKQRDCEVKVRSHFRGIESFTWNGLKCRILPSAEDQDRAAMPKQEPTHRPL